MTDEKLDRALALKKVIKKLEEEKKTIECLSQKEVPINSEELKNLLFIANINTRRTLNNFKKEFEEL